METLDHHSGLVIATFIGIIILVINPLKVNLPPNRFISTINLDFTTVPLLGILVLLATGSIGIDQVKEGIIGTTMKPFGIVILVIALSYISVSLDLTGLFSAMAMMAAKRSGGSGKRLFLNLYLLSALVTIFASNDVVVLTLTPIVIYFTKTLQLNPLPFLIASFHAANTASTVLLIGNPTNIIVGETFGLGFFTYSAWMVLPTLGACCTSFMVMYWMFRSDIPDLIAIPSTLPDPSSMITSKSDAWFCSIVMVTCLVSLAISSIWQTPVWMVTLAFSSILIVRDIIQDIQQYLAKKGAGDVPIVMGSVPLNSEEELRQSTHDEEQGLTVKASETKPFAPHLQAVVCRMPWKIIPFVFGMFIMVEALSKTGWVSRLSLLLAYMSQSTFGAVISVSFVSALACVLINNQPMSILFSKALSHPMYSVSQAVKKGAYFALILGSNLGGNLMIQAALAGFMWVHVLESKNIKVTWSTFAYYGFLGMIPSILIASIILAIETTIVQ